MLDYIVWFFAAWGVTSFIKTVVQIATYFDELVRLIKQEKGTK